MPKKTVRPHLGHLQTAVMQILWERRNATLGEIRAVLQRDKPVATTTIATVLSRLEQGGFVVHREGERSRVYAPKIGHADFQRTQTQSLIDRLFGGRAAELVAHLVRESEIDDDELANLRKLIRKRGPS
jgi:BlaI family penicillinase repressor